MLQSFVPSPFSFESNIFTTLDGEKVHYISCLVENETRKPWLVFLHGQGGVSSVWQESQIIAANKGYNSLAIDLRGHGESSHPINESSFKLENLAKDIAALIESLELLNVVIVGHCSGGMVGMLLAAKKYQFIKKLILVGSCYQSSLFGKITPVPKIFPSSIRKVASIIPKGKSKPIGDYARFKNTFDIDFGRLYADIRVTTLKSFLYGYAEVFTFDATHLVENITVPTLVIGGEKDVLHPKNVTAKLAEKIAKSKIAFVKDANHILVLSKPNEVMELVLDFVEALPEANL